MGAAHRRSKRSGSTRLRDQCSQKACEWRRAWPELAQAVVLAKTFCTHEHGDLHCDAWRFRAARDQFEMHGQISTSTWLSADVDMAQCSTRASTQKLTDKLRLYDEGGTITQEVTGKLRRSTRHAGTFCTHEHGDLHCDAWRFQAARNQSKMHGAISTSTWLSAGVDWLRQYSTIYAEGHRQVTAEGGTITQ